LCSTEKEQRLQPSDAFLGSKQTKMNLIQHFQLTAGFKGWIRYEEKGAEQRKEEGKTKGTGREWGDKTTLK